ncbi:MAG: HrpJ domain-containing protein [Candidatus Rhabdochlamydia sp.]
MSKEPISPIDSAKAQKAAAAERANEQAAVIQEASEDLQAWTEEGAFLPGFMRRAESLETKVRRSPKEERSDKKERSRPVEQIDRLSEEFQQRNPELQARALRLLRSRLQEEDTAEDIQRKVSEIYPDHFLADEALDFVLQTSTGELSKQAFLARKQINDFYSREIIAGKNIAAQVQEFSIQGLETSIGLRALYREITGNPRDCNTLFNTLLSMFKYDKMKLVIAFILHSLGSDLKAKGSSIDRGELHNLLTEARKLQAILGIFRFFESRMRFISAEFKRHGLTLSDLLTFEELSKQFMEILQDRYPSGDKILQQYLKKWMLSITGDITLLSLYHRALRETSGRLYRSNQHRQELTNAMVDGLEDLYDQEEENEEGEKES